MASVLEFEINQCIERAIDLGLSPTKKIFLRRQSSFGVYIVSYGKPTAEDTGESPNNVVFVEADPESPYYKRAFLQNQYNAGQWFPCYSDSQFLLTQENLYARYVPQPVSRNGDQILGKLEARNLGENDYWEETEFVPLAYIRKLIKASGGSGGNEGHEDRIAVLEQELTKVQEDIANIDTSFNFEQLFRTTTWMVRHNLGKWPSIIQVFDVTGNMVFPAKILKDADDPEVVILRFSTAEKGSVSLIK